MISPISRYVASVAAASVLVTGGVFALAPDIDSGFRQAAVCFAALAILSHALEYQLTRKSASGSIAFLPFIATVAVAPSWTSIAILTSAAAIGEFLARRAPIKAIFNVAQTSLAVALSIFTYRLLGGESLLRQSEFELVPYTLCFVVYLAANSVAVSGAIAVSERRNIWEVWRQNTTSTLLYDVLSLPFIYGFARIYGRWEFVGVFYAAIPLLVMRQLYKTNGKLEKTNQDLLQLMVAAIEARDPYTSGHSRRVSQYSTIIGRAIGLRGRDLERVTIAALLHDVGKIHEMFAPILQKPGRLTPEERAIIELHPIKSEELVSMVGELQDLVKPVRHHHESWDGSGYPDGLKGEEIPLFSRIIMFADTIDAMTTDRPYRAALGEAEVRSELLKYSGKQFDPAICEMLLNSIHFKRLFVDRAQNASVDEDTTPQLMIAAGA